MGRQRISEPLGPVRGLVAAENRRGLPLPLLAIKRWLILSRTLHKAAKADVLASGPALSLLPALLEAAREIDLRLSLRCRDDVPPPSLETFRDAGLLDVLLSVTAPHAPHADAWRAAVAGAELPLRVQIPIALAPQLSAAAFAKRLKDAGGATVNITAADPFDMEHRCRDAQHARAALDAAEALAHAVEDAGIEANLVGVPFCQVADALRPMVVNSRQAALDHQFYLRESYSLARKLYQRPPIVADKAILMLLGMHTSYPNPIDARLLPWLLDWPWLKARLWAWHKLTRHRRLPGSVPHAKTYPPADEPNEASPFAAPCEACRMRYICDHATPVFRRVLPGLELVTLSGGPVKWPCGPRLERERYFDAVDEARLHGRAARDAMAQRAQTLMTTQEPEAEISSFEYRLEDQWSHQVHGGVRWHGFTNTEKLTTPLARLTPPFTLSVTIGGGTAEHAGFAIGRHGRVLCPMETYAHTLALHVEADGQYVMLRDGKPVRPVEFEGQYYVPQKLGDIIEPRLAIWNIDGTIVTQTVLLWKPKAPAAAAPATYSVVIVCARYARRLQAALQAIGHQHGVPLSEIEVVIAYVPGQDPTEDVIDSIRAAFPGLRVVRVPFDAAHGTLKGFMINETVQAASGGWIVLLDADIILPPTFFQRLGAVASGTQFVAPDGRKMLPSDVTAKVLLNEIRPWEQWDALVEGPGEFRQREVDGVPIGYCQVVRKACFETVRYDEYGHFEGADWKFGKDMRDAFGDETRLEGLPVLHLDHGGSKWYGTKRQY